MMRYLITILLVGMTSCATVKAGSLGDGAAKTIGTIPAASVYFATASNKVPKSGEKLVEDNARWMNENPKAVLVLEGHCDERGGKNYNLELGDRRARSVLSMLMNYGVSGDRAITVISYGKERPIDPAHNEKAWRKNRRVDFVVR